MEDTTKIDTVEPAPAELPSHVEEVDRLKLENLQLRVMNQQRRRELLLREAKEAEATMDAMRREYLALLGTLALKYRFNPATDEMAADTGEIRRNFRPAPPTE